MNGSERKRTVAWRAALCLVAVSGGCRAVVQRLPGPLILPEDPPATAPEEANGALMAFVQRDSDPVWIRRPGERGYYPLPFYRKRERLATGSEVRSGAGGRAEITWTPGTTSLLLFDEGSIVLGDPERDEALVRFHSVTHALLTLEPSDEIELVGGARLHGDPKNATTPILIERPRIDILRLTNQSKLAVQVRMREESLEVGPGESLDLPVLATGGAPREPEAEPQVLGMLSAPVAFWGNLEHSGEGETLGLRAIDGVRVHALGIEARLAAGEGMRIVDFAAPRPAPAPDPRQTP